MNLGNNAMRKITVILLGLLLASCTQAGYYEAVAEKATKDAGDIAASALEDAPCLIGLGPWSRMEDWRKRVGAFYLCVPDAERFGVTIQALPE